MGFFNSGTGSKLANPNTASGTEEEATIPVVTDTVEEDTAASYAQKSNRRTGMKSTLLSKTRRTAVFDSPAGNTFLG